MSKEIGMLIIAFCAGVLFGFPFWLFVMAMLVQRDKRRNGIV